MDGTYRARDLKRAQQWLDRSTGLSYVSPEVVGLLTQRLSVRHRAGLWIAPFGVAAVVISASVTATGTFGTARFDHAFATRFLAAYAVLCVGLLVVGWVVNRGERRIGFQLPQRATRGTAVPLGMMLGRVRTVATMVTVAVEVTLAIALIALPAGWLTWAFLAGLLASCLLAAAGVKQASSRPTIAIDPVSLAIDERLKAADAYAATTSLYLLLFAFPGGDFVGGPPWLALMWLTGFVLIGTVRLWGQYRATWGSTVPRARVYYWPPQSAGPV